MIATDSVVIDGSRTIASIATAVVADTVVMMAFGDHRAMNRGAVAVAQRGADRDQREQQPRHCGDTAGFDAELLDEERQDRAEAAIDRLQREDDGERQQEAVRAGQLAEHRTQAAARLARLAHARLAIEDDDHYQRHHIEQGRHRKERRSPTSGASRPPMTGPMAGPSRCPICT